MVLEGEVSCVVDRLYVCVCGTRCWRWAFLF